MGAYQYLLKHIALKDSISNASKKLKEADIFKQIDQLEKNYEFVQLQQNNKLQQYYLIIAIIFGLMVLLIMFLVFRNWQRSKKNLGSLSILNEQINHQNHTLEHALGELNINSQEKDRILRTVAHDLRNPLGGVASLAGMMVDDEDYNEDQKELINLIMETSNNSIELINDILEATEGVSDRPDKEKELVELNSLLNNSIELMRFKAAEKKQQIIFEANDSAIELFIYREQIWRVISNLLSNAIKFSPERGIIRVKLSEDDKLVNISVTDDGIGIPDSMQDKIFNIFTEAKRPGTAGEKSFGLGLSICKQIIEKHNGKIWFESNSDKGTVFHVSLNK
jgi:signal transduction histidine kinase